MIHDVKCKCFSHHKYIIECFMPFIRDLTSFIFISKKEMKIQLISFDKNVEFSPKNIELKDFFDVDDIEFMLRYHNNLNVKNLDAFLQWQHWTFDKMCRSDVRLCHGLFPGTADQAACLSLHLRNAALPSVFPSVSSQQGRHYAFWHMYIIPLANIV